MYKCFSGDTKVITWDGEKNISDIAGSCQKILDGNGDWVDAPFFYLGNQETYEIHLRRNKSKKIIRATGDHRWFVRGKKGFVTTDKLKPNSRLDSVFPKNKKVKQINEDGIRHGIVYGDGTISSGRSRVCLFGEKMEFANRYFRGNKQYRYNYEYKGTTKPYIVVDRLPLEYKSLPSNNSSENYLLGFLAGVLATDGYVDHSGSVLLSSSKIEFLEYIKTICTRLGIVTYEIKSQSRIGKGRISSDIFTIYFAQSTLSDSLILRKTSADRFSKFKHPFSRTRWVVDRVVKTGIVEPVFCASVETTKSFVLADNILTGNCWGCGVGGGVFRFVMDMERISFPEAIKKLGARLGIVVEEEETEESKERKQMESALFSASKYFLNALIGPAGAEARRQLKARGFNKEICEEWGIGFAPANYSLSGNPKILQMAGLLLENGVPKFRDRIMFAVHNESGNVVGFSGRTTINHPAKYLNSPDSKLFSKGKLLYGMHKAKREIIDAGKIVIVEGQIDAIRCHLNGIKNAVAPLGTAFTNHHCETIKRLCPEVVLALDSDKAGREASRKIFCALAPIGIDVKSVVLPDGKDPDQYILDGGNLSSLIKNASGYIESLANSMIGKLETAEEKLNAAKQIGLALSKIEDGIIRDSIVSSVAPKIGVSIGELNKHAALRGGHKSVPTESKTETSEAVKSLVAHIIYNGKQSVQGFNWSIVDNQDVKMIMSENFDHTNSASVALLLSRLSPEIESYIVDLSKESLESVNVAEIYRSLLGLELKRKTDEIAKGGNIKDLIPLLEEYKNL